VRGELRTTIVRLGAPALVAVACVAAPAARADLVSPATTVPPVTMPTVTVPSVPLPPIATPSPSPTTTAVLQTNGVLGPVLDDGPASPAPANAGATTPAPAAAPHAQHPSTATSPVPPKASPSPREGAKPLTVGRLGGLAAESARRFTFPIGLATLVVLFLLAQHWVDARDPKLALAPLDDDLRSFQDR